MKTRYKVLIGLIVLVLIYLGYKKHQKKKELKNLADNTSFAEVTEAEDISLITDENIGIPEARIVIEN